MLWCIISLGFTEKYCVLFPCNSKLLLSEKPVTYPCAGEQLINIHIVVYAVLTHHAKHYMWGVWLSQHAIHYYMNINKLRYYSYWICTASGTFDL